MAFLRTVEDFVCEHCGATNRGDGYTNHCRHCLHSKHVDVDPGDRDESCHGLMVPIRVEMTSARTAVVHRCRRCAAERRCRVGARDDRDTLAAVAQAAAEAATAGPPAATRLPRQRRRD